MSTLILKVSGSTNPFDEWFLETHNGTGEFELESDVDECEEDYYGDE